MSEPISNKTPEFLEGDFNKDKKHCIPSFMSGMEQENFENAWNVDNYSSSGCSSVYDIDIFAFIAGSKQTYIGSESIEDKLRFSIDRFTTLTASISEITKNVNKLALKNAHEEEDKDSNIDYLQNNNQIEKVNSDRMQLLAKKYVDKEFPKEDEARLSILQEKLSSLVPQLTSSEYDKLEEITNELKEIKELDTELQKELDDLGKI